VTPQWLSDRLPSTLTNPIPWGCLWSLPCYHWCPHKK
jgi:hypothetical protein